MIKADRQRDGSFLVSLDAVDYHVLERIQTEYSMTYDQCLIWCINKGFDRFSEIQREVGKHDKTGKQDKHKTEGAD